VQVDMRSEPRQRAVCTGPGSCLRVAVERVGRRHGLKGPAARKGPRSGPAARDEPHARHLPGPERGCGACASDHCCRFTTRRATPRAPATCLTHSASRASRGARSRAVPGPARVPGD